MREMNDPYVFDENWDVLMSAFPNGWQELGKKTGAIKHELKDFRSESNLLRVLLIHIGNGYSLRETAVIAKAAGLADVSDVAILKRLRKSEAWLFNLCQQLLKESLINIPAMESELKIRMVDSSIINEPGKTGRQWRLHFSLTLPDLHCDYFKICPIKGEGTGEIFAKYPVKNGDYIMGDKGYSTISGVEHIHLNHAYITVRVNTQILPLYKKDGRQFDLLKTIKDLKKPLQIKEWDVCVKSKSSGLIEGRVCVLRKSENKIKEEFKKLKTNASKKQRELKSETLEYAKYVIVFSTYSKQKFSSEDVLELYRLRWQIELMLKNLKTLLNMGHVPKIDLHSSRAWLYGKLFLALLTEKLARITRAFSPWGYVLPKQMV